ncbi:hypothetical protein KKF55_00120 [Patescibacteria group bacterium]|nr:hypothetical protein [Patescibacteria group bacterium]
MLKSIILLISSLLVSGCVSVSEKPVIDFIGISTGTLTTELNDLNFRDQFEIYEHELVSAISFNTVPEGTQIQATWFSPDDRRMPLGRKTITTQSGAKIARFSLASKEDWAVAPFMLDIRANYGEGDTALTASGQIHFFIGLNDEQIESYKNEYTAWKENEAEKQRFAKIKQDKEQEVLSQIRISLNAPKAGIASRLNMIGDQQDELVIVDPMSEEPSMGSTATGAIFEAKVDQMAIVDMSGSTIFSLNNELGERTVHRIQGDLVSSIQSKGQVQVIVFEDSVELIWEEKKETCTQRFVIEDDWVSGEDKECESRN